MRIQGRLGDDNVKIQGRLNEKDDYMMCFKDMSFCSSDCIKTDCFRNWNDEQKAACLKWWGKPGGPVGFMDFSGDCPDYQPAPKEPTS